jgi:ABC-2 type transport system permease protein
MTRLLRAGWAIARRDYVATVFSKTFLIFLLFPLLPLIVGGAFGAMGADQDRQALRPSVAVVAAPDAAAAIGHAAARLRARLGEDALPRLTFRMPAADGAAQVRSLLADRKVGVGTVWTGGVTAPVLTGSRDGIAAVRDRVGLIADGARALRAGAPAQVAVAERPVDRAAGTDASGRALLARGSQLLLMVLAMALASMLLSHLIEEKSSKVIEILAAAVPVDAIFLGKLAAMLAMSLTGIAIWGGAAAGMLALAADRIEGLPALPVPAVGWGAFAALGLAYFTTLFLLLGALFLGIGGQASSAREVQMLSLPVTLGQVGMLAFASSSIAAPRSAMGVAAAWFPWSSPFAMLARAAQEPLIWPHLLAILWQMAWVALIVRLAAGLFRRSVLKSGGGGRRLRWRRG